MDAVRWTLGEIVLLLHPVETNAHHRERVVQRRPDLLRIILPYPKKTKYPITFASCACASNFTPILAFYRINRRLSARPPAGGNKEENAMGAGFSKFRWDSIFFSIIGIANFSGAREGINGRCRAA